MLHSAVLLKAVRYNSGSFVGSIVKGLLSVGIVSTIAFIPVSALAQYSPYTSGGSNYLYLQQQQQQQQQKMQQEQQRQQMQQQQMYQQNRQNVINQNNTNRLNCMSSGGIGC